ncbi:pilus assembly protein PilM [Chloroflexota bacterium]
MANAAITLEIGSSVIRLMETRGRRIMNWASLSLDPGIVEKGVVSDPQALGAAVKQLMIASGIRGSRVIASISGLYSMNFYTLVPNVPGASRMQQAVREAAEEALPLYGDEVYLSWQTVATSDAGQQVLNVGVPRKTIDTEIRALRAAGIRPHLMESRTMALARAANKKDALILNIDSSSFDIVLLVNGAPEIMRTIAWQQEDLTAEERAEHLVVTLELTVGFYNSHHVNATLDPATLVIIITGQMSGDFALIEKLQDRVVYPLEPLAPPLEYPAHLPVSQYAVNIGLALKGTAPPENPEPGEYLVPDINLLPEIYRPWKPSTKQVYYFCAILAAVALLFPPYQVTTNAVAKSADLQKEYVSLNNKLQLRQVEIKKREPLQKAIDEYRTIVDLGGGFAEDLEVIYDEVEGLGIRLESVAHQGESLAVTCEADSYLDFRDYLTALEESARFSTPIPPPEGYPYTTSGTIHLEPAAAKPTPSG